MYVKSLVEVARMLIARSGKLPFCAGARAPISENSDITDCVFMQIVLLVSELCN